MDENIVELEDEEFDGIVDCDGEEREIREQHFENEDF